MNRNNHEDNTNKARHNIYEYAQKNSEKYIKKLMKWEVLKIEWHLRIVENIYGRWLF